MIPIDCKSLYHKQKIQYFCSVILSPCRLPIGEPALCYGDEENAHIYAVHLTTANQSEIRKAYLVSAKLYFYVQRAKAPGHRPGAFIRY